MEIAKRVSAFGIKQKVKGRRRFELGICKGDRISSIQ